MQYEEVLKYDVGKKIHPRFKAQFKIAEHKPLLNDVFQLAEEFCKQNSRPLSLYNIEIKSTPEEEQNGYQPSVPVFCELLMKQIIKQKFNDRCTVQSFDVRVLNYLHVHFPQQKLVYLVENNADKDVGVDDGSDAHACFLALRLARTALTSCKIISSSSFSLRSSGADDLLKKLSIRLNAATRWLIPHAMPC